MKTLYTLFAGMLCWTAASSQCSVDAQRTVNDCYANCDGTAAIFSSTGTSPFTYAWSNGDTGASTDSLCADTTYIVTMTDALGCVAQDTVSMVAPFYYINSHQVTNASCSTCCDGTDTLILSYSPAECLPLMYQWGYYPFGDIAPTPDNYRLTLCPGSYTVMVTDNCGCAWGVIVSTIYFNTTTGTGTEEPGPSVTVTTTRDQLFISSPVTMEHVDVFNVNGQLLYTNDKPGQQLDIRLNDPGTSAIIVSVVIGGKKVTKTVLRE